MYFFYGLLLLFCANLFCMQDESCQSLLNNKGSIEACLVSSINKNVTGEERNILIQELAARLNNPQRKKECLQKGSYELSLRPEYAHQVAQKMIEGTPTKEVWLARIAPNKQTPFYECVGYTNTVKSVCYSPDSTQIVVASCDGNVDEWDIKDQPSLKKRYHQDGIWQTKALFSPDGKKIAVTSLLGELKIFAADHLIAPQWKTTYISPVSDVSFSADNSMIAVALQDCTVYLEVAVTGNRESKLFNKEKIGRVSCSDVSNLLACAGQGVTLWDAQMSNKLSECLDLHRDYINEVKFKGDLLATASQDCTALISDARDKMEVVQCYPHKDPVTSLAFHPNGTIMVTASGDRVRSWDLRMGRFVEDLVIDKDPIECVRWNKEGTQLATASGNSAKLWRTNNEDIRRYLDLDLTPETAAVLSSVTKSLQSTLKGNTQDDIYQSPGVLRITKQLPLELRLSVENEIQPAMPGKTFAAKDQDPDVAARCFDLCTMICPI